jgi:hypothetical protein
MSEDEIDASIRPPPIAHGEDDSAGSEAGYAHHVPAEQAAQRGDRRRAAGGRKQHLAHEAGPHHGQVDGASHTPLTGLDQ